MPARISGSWPAARQLDADVAIAAQVPGARQHEIAEAAQTRQRFAPAAGGAGQPRHLRQAARDQRGQRVVAEAEPLDDAGGNRDDVLQRPADLDADDVVAAVQTEVRAAELLLHELGRVGVGEAASTAVGSCCATSTAKLGPDSTTTGCAGPELLRDHLRHPQQRVGLQALRRADDRWRPRRCAARPRA